MAFLDLALNCEAIPDSGGLVHIRLNEPVSKAVVPLGAINGARRFTCLHRFEPFWMAAKVVEKIEDVPPETQFLLADLGDNKVGMIIPFIDEPFRASLQGSPEGLMVVLETGDPATVADQAVAILVKVDSQIGFAIDEAAEVIARYLGDPRLLSINKDEPGCFNYFGWCTWDAFYQEVSEEKVREGLESFRAGGVPPKLLILDDGWQSVVDTGFGGKRLASFETNEKFGGSLGPTVQMAKEEFGVAAFFVWHAMNGYWGGVDDASLPGYGVRNVPRRSSEGIRGYQDGQDWWWGKAMGLVSSDHIYRFFHDYHRVLRAQGVDGVKVDAQGQLESVADGIGGRVSLMRQYREALEGSVAVHFAGNLINCMSCSNDMLYTARASTVTRTSPDFYPNQPETHGRHMYVNALVGLWFGAFVRPDWDMFQSGHPAGRFHAIGRAISGGPVYVSDKVGEHDFDLLRKLVTPEGQVFRTIHAGIPSYDCLFVDPTKDMVLWKIQGQFRSNNQIALFNCHHEPCRIKGSFKPTDIDDTWCEAERFAVYRHGTDELRVLLADETWEIELAELEADMFTVAPIDEGFAAIGITDYFNAAGTVWDAVIEFGATVRLTAPGHFVAWCEEPPTQVTVDEDVLEFRFADGRMDVDVDGMAPTVTIEF